MCTGEAKGGVENREDFGSSRETQGPLRLRSGQALDFARDDNGEARGSGIKIGFEPFLGCGDFMDCGRRFFGDGGSFDGGHQPGGARDDGCDTAGWGWVREEETVSGACRDADDGLAAEPGDDRDGDVAFDGATGDACVSWSIWPLVFCGAGGSWGAGDPGGRVGDFYCAGGGNEAGSGEVAVSELEAVDASGVDTLVGDAAEWCGNVFCVVWGCGQVRRFVAKS
jgi:hypothetical protein